MKELVKSGLCVSAGDKGDSASRYGSGELGFTCVICSISEEMDHNSCGKELEASAVNGGEWFGAECSSSVVYTVNPVSSNTAVNVFSR